MVSKKFLRAGLLLASLSLADLQAGSFIQQLRNIHIPASLKQYAHRMLNSIHNNPKVALISLLASPIVALTAAWSARYAWNRFVQNRPHHEQPILPTHNNQQAPEVNQPNVPNNNTGINDQQQPTQTNNQLLNQPVPTQINQPNLPSTSQPTTSQIPNNNTGNINQQRPTQTNNQLPNQPVQTQINQPNLPSTSQPHTGEPLGTGHPFFKAGYIVFNDGDYKLNVPQELQHVTTSVQQVEINPLNTTSQTTQNNQKDKEKEKEKENENLSLTNSFVVMDKPKYECLEISPAHERNEGKICLVCPLDNSDNLNEKELKDLKQSCHQFGRYIAHALEKNIDIIFYPWFSTPNINTVDTTADAEKLAQLIRQRNQNIEASNIWTIAHNGSCKLINRLAEVLNKKIDLAIHIASPGTDSITNPHFKNLYNFYSTDDLHQARQTWKALRKYPLASANNLHNIRVQINDTGIKSALELRNALMPQNLIGSVFDIDTHYDGCDDLDTCYSDKAPGYPLVALHRKPALISENTRMYSDMRNNKFRAIYLRDITDKGNTIHRIGNTTAQVGQQALDNATNLAQHVVTQVQPIVTNHVIIPVTNGVHNLVENHVPSVQETRVFGYAVYSGMKNFLGKHTPNVVRHPISSFQGLINRLKD